jgi:hypothetical protein
LYVATANEFTADPAGHFFNTFRIQNQHLFSKDENLKTQFEKYAADCSPDSAVHFMSRVLKNHKRPVFYIIDEHNELFKRKASSFGIIYHFEQPLLNNFTNWVSAVKGQKTFTLYAGSAHSKFLRRLPGGEEHRVRHIGVMNDREFRVVIGDETSPFYFRDTSKILELQSTIGKVLRYLKAIDNLHNRQESLRTDLDSRLEEWIRETKSEGRDVVEFLRGAGFGGFRVESFFKSTAYDAGLVYFDERGAMLPVNGIARQLLLRAWAREINVKPLNTIDDPGEKGVRFEEQFLRTLLTTSTLSFTCYDPKVGKKLKRNQKPVDNCSFQLDLSKLLVVPDFAKRNGDACTPNMDVFEDHREFLESNSTTLWIPGVPNFPYLDFILDARGVGQNRRLFVFQCSVSKAKHFGAQSFFTPDSQFLEKTNQQNPEGWNKMRISYKNIRETFKLEAGDELIFVLVDGSDKYDVSKLMSTLVLDANCHYVYHDALKKNADGKTQFGIVC